MRTWEELSLSRKTLYISFTLFYFSLEKVDELMKLTKEAYDIFRKERMRKAGMN